LAGGAVLADWDAACSALENDAEPSSKAIGVASASAETVHFFRKD
jgi:hypothetical protein